jgi:transposase-like protein
MARRRSWDKAHSAHWSQHVETWYLGDLEAADYCQRRKLARATFERWMRHLVSPEDLRKRTEHQRKLRRGAAARRRETAPRKHRYSARTDTRSIAVQAFWGMHVEAMNWSGMGLAEYAAALRLSPHALRKWRDRLDESGAEMDWRSLLHPSARAQLSSAANCARRRYRLTLEQVDGGRDGRANRRRFTDEQKRAIVLETEKPGVSVAEVCRRHGIATSMVFRWRLEFGLAARKAPQLATVALADGAESEPSALAALRDLVRPPDGMIAIELDDGRRVFAPVGSNPEDVKQRLVERENTP